MIEGLVVFIMVMWLFSGFACSYIARSKDRSGVVWFILGLVFGLFAIITIGFTEKAETKEKED